MPKTTTLTAFDPGETTGFAIVLVQDGACVVDALGTWKGLTALTVFFGKLEERCTPELFIIEDYRIYPHKARAHVGARPYALCELGRLQLYAHLLRAQVAYQMASSAKQRWPKQRVLRHYPEHHEALRNPHILNALQHALTYAERNGLVVFPPKGVII